MKGQFKIFALALENQLIEELNCASMVWAICAILGFVIVFLFGNMWIFLSLGIEALKKYLDS